MTKLMAFASVWTLFTLPVAAQGTAAAPDVSLAVLAQQTFLAFKQVPTGTNLWILAGTGGLAWSVAPYDSHLTHEAVVHTGFEGAVEPGKAVGHGTVQIGGAIATYVVGRIAGSPRTAAVGSDLIRAQAVNGVLTHAVKLAWNRPRPDGSGHSFPSGHTSSTVATATVLQRHFGWKVGVPAYAVASYVGLSRLTENKHYASDVIFGAGIGLVAGRSVTVGHGHVRFDVSPVPAPGGGAIAVTLLPRRSSPRRRPAT